MTKDREKTKKLGCPIDRRKFCKAVPYAAMGALSASVLKGMPLGVSAATAKTSVNAPYIKKEESMADIKKITAVKAKVKSVKGTCGIHKVGDVAKFTENGVEGKICIHALYSMMPAVFAMLYGATFPWLDDPDTKTHACPDAANPVVFEISRIRE